MENKLKKELQLLTLKTIFLYLYLYSNIQKKSAIQNSKSLKKQKLIFVEKFRKSSMTRISLSPQVCKNRNMQTQSPPSWKGVPYLSLREAPTDPNSKG